MWKQIKGLNEERGQILAEMKKLLNTAQTEKRDLTTEQNVKFTDLNTRAEAIKSQIENLNKVNDIEQALTAGKSGEQRAGREDLNTPEQRAEAKTKAEKAEFRDYLCHGTVNQNTETRALTVSGTGVVGPRAFYNSVVSALVAYAGVRQAGATIIPTTDGNPLTIPVLNDSSNTGRLVGEGVTNATETLPTPANVTLTAYKFDSDWIKVSTELLRDSGFPIEAYIAGAAAERLGRAQNVYFTTGTGSTGGQPKGFVAAGTVGKTVAAVNAVTYEEMIDFVHSLDAAYRSSGKATMQFHDTTLAAIRKMKDTVGHYIWAPGEAGAPNRIMDYPYVVNNNMAQLSDGAAHVVAAFGDFSRYFVRDVTGIEVYRAVELFISDGLIGFKFCQRSDGNLADTSAVKLLKTAASAG